MSLAAPPVLEPPPPDARLFTAAGGNLLVRAPPGLPDTALSPPAPGGTVPLEGGASRAVEFETDLFKGRFKVLFKVPAEQQAPLVTDMLRGKRRQMWVMVQGRLKRSVPLDDLMYGSWFLRQLRFPAPFVVGPALHWLAARFGSSLHMQLRGDSPHVIGPLCGAVQMLNVSPAGREPDLVAAQEDTRLLFGPDCTGDPMPPAKRKAYFRRASHRAGKAFTPDHVITLHCFDHSFNYHTFRMAVPPCFHLDMVKVLDAQPVCIQLQDRRSAETIFRFEVWHRRMLEHLQRHGPRIQRSRERARLRRLGGGSSDASGSWTGAAFSCGRGAPDGLGSVDEGGGDDGPLAAARAALAAHRIALDESEGGSAFEGSEGADDDDDDDDDDDLDVVGEPVEEITRERAADSGEDSEEGGAGAGRAAAAAAAEAAPAPGAAAALDDGHGEQQRRREAAGGEGAPQPPGQQQHIEGQQAGAHPGAQREQQHRGPAAGAALATVAMRGGASSGKAAGELE